MARTVGLSVAPEPEEPPKETRRAQHKAAKAVEEAPASDAREDAPEPEGGGDGGA